MRPVDPAHGLMVRFSFWIAKSGFSVLVGHFVALVPLPIPLLSVSLVGCHCDEIGSEIHFSVEVLWCVLCIC